MLERYGNLDRSQPSVFSYVLNSIDERANRIARELSGRQRKTDLTGLGVSTLVFSFAVNSLRKSEWGGNIICRNRKKSFKRCSPRLDVPIECSKDDKNGKY